MIGDLLQQRYQIVNFLGKGGQGHTYLAIDKHRPGNPKCVVKHLKPFFNDPQFLETAKRLFQSEAEILGKLANYTHIPQLYAYFEQNKEFFLVQEFIDGDDLSKEISNGKILDEHYIISLLKGILPILEVLHQKGIIHRDIKPPNIIRRRADKQLVLIDFGAVKQFQHDLTCGANLSIDIGSPGYTPSEQLRGRPKPSSDIYALGMMCVQALTGVHPRKLEEDESEEVRWQHLTLVNPILGEILKKMVRHNTKERYKSATEVLIALERYNYQSSAPKTNSVDRFEPNNESDSTLVAPSQNSGSSPSTPQPFDPWTTSSFNKSRINSPNPTPAKTEIVPSVSQDRAKTNPPTTPPNSFNNAETEVFSSNTNSRLNPPIPSSNPTSAKTEIVPPGLGERNNSGAVPRNPSNIETEVFSSNTNSRLNPPISPQIPANTKTEIIPPGLGEKNNSGAVPRNPSNVETEVFSSNTNSRLNPPISSPNPTTAKTEIVPPVSQHKTNSPVTPRNRPLDNKNTIISGAGRNEVSPPARNYSIPRNNYRPSNRRKKPKKIYPIAIGAALAALSVVGFFGFIQPTFLTKDSKINSVASKPKTTTKNQKADSTKPKTDKSTTSNSTKSTQSKQSDFNTEKYYNSEPIKGLSQDLAIDTETTQAKQLMAKANKLATGGKLQEAIVEADKVTPQTGDEYLNAQTKIDKWSNSLIQKAIYKYQQQGKLNEAIAMLKSIPESVSQSQTSSELISKWNQEWTDNQVYMQDAQRAIIDSRWQDATYAADGLSDTNPYWQSKKAKLKQEIIAKKTSSEKKEQQVATQPQEVQPQPAQPQMAIQPQSAQPQPQPETATKQSQPQQIARKDATTSSASSDPASASQTSNGCTKGYVWREATPEDRICVTPQVRQQVAFDNSQVEDRRSAAAYDPETCVDGYVWREATPDDRVCVTPQVRQQTLQDNAQAQSRIE
jgi:serine/threonine protein kinase